MNEPQDTFWWRLMHLQPEIYKGLIVAIAGFLASVGVMVAPAIPDAVIGAIAAIAALVQAIWTKTSVTANARVVSFLPNPIEDSRDLQAGEAVTTTSDARIISAATTKGGPDGAP